MSNLLTHNKEFEQKPNQETERKFVPIFPEQLQEWREQSLPIEQLYLSHPSEEFGLRLREHFDTDGTARYSAALKSRGEITANGLSRMEIETEISEETYLYYRSEDTYPVLRKLRASPLKNIDIDFYENGDVTLEAEHPLSLLSFLDRYPYDLDERTGDKSVDNEHRAHFEYRRTHGGAEVLLPPEDTDSALNVARKIYPYHLSNKTVVATISGRSGSGKSTLVHEVSHELDGTIPRIITLSTDDYHVGKKWLDNYNDGKPWQDWDAEIVYDLDALRADLEKFRAGEPIYARRFNFQTQEPEITGVIEPSSERTLVLVEGIYAGSPKLEDTAHVRHEVQTPLATCIGRRLNRDFFSGERINESLPDPAVVLRYLLENAEPAYRAQTT